MDQAAQEQAAAAGTEHQELNTGTDGHAERELKEEGQQATEERVSKAQDGWLALVMAPTSPMAGGHDDWLGGGWLVRALASSVAGGVWRRGGLSGGERAGGTPAGVARGTASVQRPLYAHALSCIQAGFHKRGRIHLLPLAASASFVTLLLFAAYFVLR